MSETVDPTKQQCRPEMASFVSGGTVEPNGEGASGLSCLEYNSEGLPVLIRLPDLTRAIASSNQPSSNQSSSNQSSSNQPGLSESGQPERPYGPSLPQATMESPSAKATAEQVDQVSRRRKSDRRGTRIGRRSGAKNGHRWLHNLGQIAMAAVLALVLLAIIIAFQDRSANSPNGSSSTVGEAMGVAFEFAQEPIGPAVDVGFDPNTAMNGSGAKWPPDPAEVAGAPESQRPEESASSFNGSSGQSKQPFTSETMGFEALRTAALPGAPNLTANPRKQSPDTRRAADDVPPFDRSAPGMSRSPISSGDIHRDSGVLPVWHHGRSIESEVPLDTNSARRYPSTDARPISTKPMAVPRFSEDQWRRDALSSGASQARRPRHRELLPSHQNPSRETHQSRDNRPRYERSGSGLY